MGKVNPWVLLADGTVRDVDPKDLKKGSKNLDTVKIDGQSGIIIGKNGAKDLPRHKMSSFVEGLKNMDPKKAQKVYEQLADIRKKVGVKNSQEILSKIGKGGFDDLIEAVDTLGSARIKKLIKAMQKGNSPLKGGQRLGAILKRASAKDIDRMFTDFKVIKKLPGAKGIMDDFISGGKTAKGAIAEIQYAAKLHRDGVKIKQLGDVVGGKKAGDIILHNGKVIDVKFVDWKSERFWRSGKFRQANIDEYIEKSLANQLQLHKTRYPNAPIRYAFKGEVPKQVKEALEKAGVEVIKFD